MQTEEFTREVAEIAGLSDQDTAAAVSRATVEVICAYLPANQARDLASQLPAELTQAAEAGINQSAGGAGEITQAQFFERVATRAEVDRDSVEPAARAAITVFKRALSRGQSTDVVMDAPPELDALLSG